MDGHQLGEQPVERILAHERDLGRGGRELELSPGVAFAGRCVHRSQLAGQPLVGQPLVGNRWSGNRWSGNSWREYSYS